MKLVAGVQQQRILVLGSDLVNCVFDARVATVATTGRIGTVGSRRREFGKVSMNVIRMNESFGTSMGEYKYDVVVILTHVKVPIGVDATLGQASAVERVLMNLLRGSANGTSQCKRASSEILLHFGGVWWSCW